MVVVVVCTEAVVLFRVTAIAAAVAVIVTCADAFLLVSAWETAVTVTAAGEGTVAGAVYIPVALIVPCVESPPATPFTCHVTAVLEVFETVAVKGLVVPTWTEALVGATATVMPGGGGVTFDFTSAHPHAAKPITSKAATDENFDRLFCIKWRKFMYSYPPRKLLPIL